MSQGYIPPPPGPPFDEYAHDYDADAVGCLITLALVGLVVAGCFAALGWFARGWWGAP